MENAKLFLAVDIGSTFIKSSIIGEDGYPLKSSRAKLPLSYTDGSAELYPADLWHAFVDSVSPLNCRSLEITGIGVASQMAGLILLNENKEPVRNAIPGIDERGKPFVGHLKESLGEASIYDTTGCPLSGIYPAPKLLWIQRHEPQKLQQSAYVLGFKEYVLWKLIGKMVTDPATASSTQLYDQLNADWWEDMLDTVGIKHSMLPEIRRPDETAGTLLEEAAEQLGLSGGIPVIVGTGDGPAANLSTGAVTPEEMCISFGTTAVTRFFTTNPLRIENDRRFYRQHFGGTLYLQGFRLDRAGYYIDQYIRDLDFGKDRQGDQQRRDLFFIPGSGSESAFFGETIGASSEDRFHAVLEHVTFELFDAMVPLMGLHHFKYIHPIGGGSMNRIWMQELADLFELPVVLTNGGDSTVGVSILAAKATGIYSSTSEAKNHMVHTETVLSPTKGSTKAIRSRYEKYVCFRNELLRKE